MTWASKIFTLFPTLHIGLILSSVLFFALYPSVRSLALIISTIYLFPLACFRLLNLVTPIREGKSDILAKQFSPWWAGHQIQSLFISVPSLEAVLRMIPGAFSLWLRLWGSRIGKKVYWTPGTVHYDRNLLEVGDGVVFGERSLSVCHVISPKKNSAELTIAKVRLGAGAFVGAACVLSPGVTMEPKSFVKAGVRVYPHQHIAAQDD
jgi:acetyltransferase-like isoleucine patch superfamily enzyme